MRQEKKHKNTTVKKSLYTHTRTHEMFKLDRQ